MLLISRGVPQQLAAPTSSGGGGGWQLQWPMQPMLAASADTAPWPTQPMLAASAGMAPWAPPLGEAPPPPPWPPQEPQSLEDLRSPLPAWAPSLAQPLPWMPPQALEGTSRASGLMPPSFGPPMMPGLLTGHPEGRRDDSTLHAQLLDDAVARRMQVETSRTDEAWQRQLNEERLRHSLRTACGC